MRRVVQSCLLFAQMFRSGLYHLPIEVKTRYTPQRTPKRGGGAKKMGGQNLTRRPPTETVSDPLSSVRFAPPPPPAILARFCFSKPFCSPPPLALPRRRLKNEIAMNFGNRFLSPPPPHSALPRRRLKNEIAMNFGNKFLPLTCFSVLALLRFM